MSKKTNSTSHEVSGVTAAANRLAQQQGSRVFPADPVGKHIARLLKLHPDLQVQFRDIDLATLNDATKKCLLEDINDVLGITPLQASSS